MFFKYCGCIFLKLQYIYYILLIKKYRNPNLIKNKNALKSIQNISRNNNSTKSARKTLKLP